MTSLPSAKPEATRQTLGVFHTPGLDAHHKVLKAVQGLSRKTYSSISVALLNLLGTKLCDDQSHNELLLAHTPTPENTPNRIFLRKRLLSS